MHMSIELLLKWDLSLGKRSGLVGFLDLGATNAEVGAYKYSKGGRIQQQKWKTECYPNLVTRGSELTNNEINKGE